MKNFVDEKFMEEHGAAGMEVAVKYADDFYNLAVEIRAALIKKGFPEKSARDGAYNIIGSCLVDSLIQCGMSKETWVERAAFFYDVHKFQISPAELFGKKKGS